MAERQTLTEDQFEEIWPIWYNASLKDYSRCQKAKVDCVPAEGSNTFNCKECMGTARGAQCDWAAAVLNYVFEDGTQVKTRVTGFWGPRSAEELQKKEKARQAEALQQNAGVEGGSSGESFRYQTPDPYEYLLALPTQPDEMQVRLSELDDRIRDYMQDIPDYIKWADQSSRELDTLPNTTPVELAALRIAQAKAMEDVVALRTTWSAITLAEAERQLILKRRASAAAEGEGPTKIARSARGQDQRHSSEGGDEEVVADGPTNEGQVTASNADEPAPAIKSSRRAALPQRPSSDADEAAPVASSSRVKTSRPALPQPPSSSAEEAAPVASSSRRANRRRETSVLSLSSDTPPTAPSSRRQQRSAASASNHEAVTVKKSSRSRQATPAESSTAESSDAGEAAPPATSSRRVGAGRDKGKARAT
ncbi:hypothetical protein TRAPUB_8664 [Trametes pubescens]|uniref:Uncharacterized protein n=1 Tax=Trametes pubescens TaxID=154538 RepID=A0A1M2W4Q7_TRAPU|nr:hypothetical protein TRAPUB_8664 [Trametes pubescens]